MTRFLTEENLIDRLRTLAKKADKIDVATAWASTGQALNVLLDFAEIGKLRAIVGIAGASTHPTALRQIMEVGELRVPTESPLFHPKVIIFRLGEKMICWTGSANLTTGGFEKNFEAAVEFVDSGDVSEWFNRTWNDLNPDPESVVSEYEIGWKPGWKSKATKHKGVSVDDFGERGLLPEDADWRTFITALESAKRFWSDSGVCWSVDGEGASWLTTIGLGHSIILNRDFRTLSKLECRQLIGRERKGAGEGYGLLGSMTGAGYANELFNPDNRKQFRSLENVRAKIQKDLRPLFKCSFEEFPDAASHSLKQITAIRGFSGAVATRLITLSRPEFGVSVNKGSVEMLSVFSGITATALGKPRRQRAPGYPELIEYLQEQPWYAHPEPVGRYEKTIRDNRGAMLDVLAYRYSR